jgi:hypothetical protein
MDLFHRSHLYRVFEHMMQEGNAVRQDAATHREHG